MKKRIVLKKWVEVVLGIIGLICIIICMSECDNTLTFFISHIISCGIILLISVILITYGRSD